MTEPDANASLPAENQAAPVAEETPEAGPPRRRLRRFFLRHLPLSLAGLLVLASLAATGLYFWASSTGFENMVRKRLVGRLEAATGGRVEITKFHWNLLRLEAEAGGIVIHGTEAREEAPYAQIDQMRVGLSVLGFFSPRVILRELEVTRPRLHMIVYADGTTNQPQPRTHKKTGESGLDTLLDLRAGHVAVDDGLLDYDNRAYAVDLKDRLVPLDFAASDTNVRMVYVAAAAGAPESFHIELGASDLSLLRSSVTRKPARRFHGRFDAALDLVRNAAYLRTLRVAFLGRTFEVSGLLQDFARPHWQAKGTGEVDMRLLEPATGYTDAPEGVARMDLFAAGEGGIFRVDGAVHVDGGSYLGPGVTVTGLQLDAHVHADPEQLLINSIVARLRQGGQLTGTVDLRPWLPPVPGSAIMQTAGQSSVRAASPKARAVLRADQILTPVNGKVQAEFRNVTLDTLMDIVGTPPFQRLGLGAVLNGPASANWIKGDVNTLSVGANFALTPVQAAPGEVPTSGVVDATYFQRNGSVDLRRMEVRTASSLVEAHGNLGAYPMTSPTSLAVDARSANLADFDTVLRDLGVARNGKQGTAALPLVLGGQAEFHGSWLGSLVDPHLTGTAKSTKIALEIPANPDDKSGVAQMVDWDAAEATGSYSATHIAIDQGKFFRGNSTVSLSGWLTADTSQPGPPVLTFDERSQLRLHLRASKVDMAELLKLSGQNLPVTGLVDAQVETSGPVGSLLGWGWVELDNGAVWGEPVARVRAQGNIVSNVLRLNSVTVKDDAGNISAKGSYDFHAKSFQISARASGMNAARIAWLHDRGMDVAGKLGLSVEGAGTLDDPRIEAHLTLDGLTVGGEPLGGLELTAHTAHRSVTYDLSTRLEAAQLKAHGQTELTGAFATQATAEFSKFNIGALFKLAHVQALSGESALAGTINLAGPLSRPEEMHGEARLQQLAMTVAGVHLHSEGLVHATLAGQRITLDPLHITGEETDLRAEGSLSIGEKKQLDFATSGTINLKVAKTIDPDISAAGTTTFQVEAHGPLSNPGLRGRVDFQDASISLEDVPNGLSQLHGTLEFNQDRLEVKSLTAMSGGGLLSLSGYLAYRNGLFADLTATGKGIRIRYPQGVSSLADATLHMQGPQGNLLVSGDVLLTRFTVSPDLDIAALAAQSSAVSPVVAPDAPSNRVRLDVHVTSSPQLNFQNAYAKLAGNVDLRVRGTVASASVLGRVSITQGSATLAGTRYELQRGDIYFTNPVRIQPSIDLNAMAHVEDYDITLGLHGTTEKLTATYRSDPPLPEADVVALLALGRSESQRRIYTQQQESAGSNPATDALLGGALNATVSSRVQRLFGAGAVKVDPSYLGALGNSTSRITVEEQLGSNIKLTYATNVNTTAQQLIQAEVAINHHVSLLVARDESGVFSVVLKATRRYR